MKDIPYLVDQLDKCKKKIQERIKFNEPIPPTLLQIYNNLATEHYEKHTM